MCPYGLTFKEKLQYQSGLAFFVSSVLGGSFFFFWYLSIYKLIYRRFIVSK